MAGHADQHPRPARHSRPLASSQPDGIAQSREFPSLREALRAAADVLRVPDAQPWIIVEDGTILKSGWIREKARAQGFQEERPAINQRASARDAHSAI